MNANPYSIDVVVLTYCCASPCVTDAPTSALVTCVCAVCLQQPSLFKRLMGVMRASTGHSSQSLNSDNSGDVELGVNGIRR
jgi:hypothetical protein